MLPQLRTPCMKTALATTLCLTLAACGHVAEPRIVIQPVNMPVPVSCVPALVGPTPRYDDTEQAWKDAPGATPAARNAERLKLLRIGRAQRDKRLAVLEPVVAG